MFDRLIASLEYTYKLNIQSTEFCNRIIQNNNFDTELNTVMFSKVMNANQDMLRYNVSVLLMGLLICIK